MPEAYTKISTGLKDAIAMRSKAYEPVGPDMPTAGPVDIGGSSVGVPANAQSVRAQALPTLYVRLPPSLKRSVEHAAAAAGQSVNVFVMRCLEKTVNATTKEGM